MSHINNYFVFKQNRPDCPYAVLHFQAIQLYNRDPGNRGPLMAAKDLVLCGSHLRDPPPWYKVKPSKPLKKLHLPIVH